MAKGEARTKAYASRLVLLDAYELVLPKDDGDHTAHLDGLSLDEDRFERPRPHPADNRRVVVRDPRRVHHGDCYWLTGGVEADLKLSDGLRAERQVHSVEIVGNDLRLAGDPERLELFRFDVDRTDFRCDHRWVGRSDRF